MFHGSDVPHGSSGSVVAVSDGEIVECRGWGESDLETGTPAGCDTVYDIGSVTKQFTAAAVVKLQMQGRLRVTDPIGDYLAGVPADKRGITIRHLLTHTAGLVEALGDDYERLTRRHHHRGAGVQAEDEPGARYHYSNVGYSLLAVIIEEASGMGYEEYLAKELFAPPGMTETGYVLPEWDAAQVAVEYGDEDRPRAGRSITPGRRTVRTGTSAGTAGSSPPRATWADGTARSRARVLDTRPGRAVPPTGARGARRRQPLRLRLGGAGRPGPLDWHNGGNGWSSASSSACRAAGGAVLGHQPHPQGAGGWHLDRTGRADRTSCERLVGGGRLLRRGCQSLDSPWLCGSSFEAEVPADLGRTTVTIGNFDGVHLGHQHVVRRAREVAAEVGIERVVVVTFDPHPIAVLRPEHAPPTLTTIDTRLARLAEAGADDALVIPFSREIAGWSPEEFIDRILVGALHAKAVVVGANFRFGNRAAGDSPPFGKPGSPTTSSWTASPWTADRRSGRRRTSATAWLPATWRARPRRWAARSSPVSWSKATSAVASSASRPPMCRTTGRRRSGRRCVRRLVAAAGGARGRSATRPRSASAPTRPSTASGSGEWSPTSSTAPTSSSTASRWR